MPTKEGLENLKTAQERLDAAFEAHHSFIENPRRQYTPKETLENQCLLQNLQLAMSGYWEAFDKVARN
jgi:hypothetical protein